MGLQRDHGSSYPLKQGSQELKETKVQASTGGAKL